ncbi:MAG: hypothetical protein KDG55_19535 [Rhodocyclaceae bacterium]|nr:hypothetical protein [Rhodocyclaceae bacterium]
MLAGLLANVMAVVAFAAATLLFPDYSLGDLLQRLRQRLGNAHPTLTATVDGFIRVSGLQPTREASKSIRLPPFPGPEAWPRHGPVAAGFQRMDYGAGGVPLESPEGSFLAGADERPVLVADSKAFLSALRQARPGQIITLAPGDYHLSQRRLEVGGGGLAGKPIVVRADRPGTVQIFLDTLEGFYIDRPFWVFENLTLNGACRSDDRCEHAFHVVGDAVGTVIRNNLIVDFNAGLKVNGLFDRRGDRFPDHGLVHNNAFYNTRARQTVSPVTLLNINGANGWVVHANFIADFEKGKGDRTSYAAFMKSNSSDGVFDGNLVVCHWKLPPSGGVRVGLSLGGGGTAAAYSRNHDNRVEHTGGMIRNNIIARCPIDVGIYLNRAAQTRIFNNALIGTRGIDVRFESSSADIRNNLLDGRIADRDGGRHEAGHNLSSQSCGLIGRVLGSCSSDHWYKAPLEGDLRILAVDEIIEQGDPAAATVLDFCGNPRRDAPDIGPIEYGSGPLCLPVPQ